MARWPRAAQYGCGLNYLIERVIPASLNCYQRPPVNGSPAASGIVGARGLATITGLGGVWEGGGVSGVKLGDLGGGGLFRWLTRGAVIASLLLTLTLRYLLGVHIVLAALAGFTALLLGLLVIWALTATGRIKIKV